MLPTSLAPLGGVHGRLVMLLDLLDRVPEPEARAELAGELVKWCARYDDAKDRAVFPALAARRGFEPELSHAERDEARVRASMREIRKRMRHVEPINVYATDPDGFEEELHELIAAARAQLALDEGELFPLVDLLDSRARVELRRRLQRAVAHASSRPDPPRNPIGRMIVGLEDRIERSVHDRPTPWHPGLRQLDRREEQPGPV